jgi:hypothetical protein
MAPALALGATPGGRDAQLDARLAAARTLFMDAEKDEDAERWAQALEKLQRVAEVKMTPGVRFHTALCEEHLGQLVNAVRDYRTAAVEARQDNATDVLRLVDLRVADASARIARLTVVPSPPDSEVTIDGQTVDAGAPVEVDPGTHAVTASARGWTPATLQIILQEGEVRSAEVPLQRIAPVLPPPVVPASTGHAAERDRALGLVAGTAALALVVGGAGAFAMAGAKRDEFARDCAQKVAGSPDACEGDRNTVRAWDGVALGLWAVAAGASAAAVISLVRAGREPLGARLVIRPGSAGVEGTF